MKRRTAIPLAALALCAGLATKAQAVDITLFNFGINIDGTTNCDFGPCDTDGLSDLSGVPGVDDSGFDYSTGLGTISVTVMGIGSHNVDLFVDHEIDEAINGFTNEYGASNGSSATGQSWEIDEPGFVFGDIFDPNFLASTLDGSNGVPIGMEDDVSMALGWDFDLLAGEAAMIEFLVSQTAPTSGLYLSQTDPDSSNNATIYFSSALSIEEKIIPEPTALALMGLGLVAIGYRRHGSKVATGHFRPLLRGEGQI